MNVFINGAEKAMMQAPQSLWEEYQKLVNIFFSQLPEFIWDHEPTKEEEAEFDQETNQWIFEHGSNELKLWLDYRNWIGDEGQLCDGKGNYLKQGDGYYDWIQEWDVNEGGYCVYKGTNELILNTDGTPI